MGYRIQVYKHDAWQIRYGFVFETEREAIQQIAHKASPNYAYRVIDDHNVEVWFGEQPAKEVAKGDLAEYYSGPSYGPSYGDETTTHYFTGGFISMDHLANLPKPLNIPRPDLVKALQVKLDEEVKKREEEQAKLDASHKDAKEAIAQFTMDELYEIFRSYFTIEVKTLQQYKIDKQFVPQEIIQERRETDLERAVRVLNLASDETVEVRPDSDLYKLL